jgi:hypothetical protein
LDFDRIRFCNKTTIIIRPNNLIIGVEYNSILVIIDKLTKYTYIILYLKANIVEDLAYIFLRIIITNYNALEKMISDRNKFFIL